MADEVAEAVQLLASEGYELRIEERDLHSEYMSHGQPGRASFFKVDALYYCLSLERGGSVVWKDFAQAPTRDEVILAAARWYRR